MGLTIYESPEFGSFDERSNPDPRAFRIVAFTIFDDPTKLVGHAYNHYSELTDHVPLTPIFISKDQRWAQDVTVEMADEFVSFYLRVQKPLGKVATSGRFSLESEHAELRDIANSHTRIINKKGSRLMSVLPTHPDQGQLRLTNRQTVGKEVLIDNFSLVIFSSTDENSVLAVKEVVTLGKNAQITA